jgi:hypothetical protein
MDRIQTWTDELTAFYCDVEELVANHLGGMERAAAYFDANPTKLRNLAQFTEDRYIIGHSAYRVANDWYTANGNSDKRYKVPEQKPATAAPAAKKEPAALVVTSTRGTRKPRRRAPKFDRYRWDDISREVDDAREARRYEWENAKIEDAA